MRGDAEAPQKAPVPKLIVTETCLGAVLATKITKATSTTATNAPVNEGLPGEAASVHKAHASGEEEKGGAEAPQKPPVHETMVPETRLAAVLATKS